MDSVGMFGDAFSRVSSIASKTSDPAALAREVKESAAPVLNTTRALLDRSPVELPRDPLVSNRLTAFQANIATSALGEMAAGFGFSGEVKIGKEAPASAKAMPSAPADSFRRPLAPGDRTVGESKALNKSVPSRDDSNAKLDNQPPDPMPAAPAKAPPVAAAPAAPAAAPTAPPVTAAPAAPGPVPAAPTASPVAATPAPTPPAATTEPMLKPLEGARELAPGARANVAAVANSDLARSIPRSDPSRLDTLRALAAQAPQGKPERVFREEAAYKAPDGKVPDALKPALVNGKVDLNRVTPEVLNGMSPQERQNFLDQLKGQKLPYDTPADHSNKESSSPPSRGPEVQINRRTGDDIPIVYEDSANALARNAASMDKSGRTTAGIAAVRPEIYEAENMRTGRLQAGENFDRVVSERARLDGADPDAEVRQKQATALATTSKLYMLEAGDQGAPDRLVDGAARGLQVAEQERKARGEQTSDLVQARDSGTVMGAVVAGVKKSGRPAIFGSGTKIALEMAGTIAPPKIAIAVAAMKGVVELENQSAAESGEKARATGAEIETKFGTRGRDWVEAPLKFPRNGPPPSQEVMQKAQAERDRRDREWRVTEEAFRYGAKSLGDS